MKSVDLTYGHLARILWDRKYFVVVPVVTALAIAILIWIFATRTYTAYSTVLLDVQSTEPLLRAPASLSPSYVSTQVDIIKSERVVRAAIAQMGLATDPVVLAQFTPGATESTPSDDWLLRWVMGSLRVAPSRESGVIEIGFQSVDPAFAAKVATGISQSFVDTSVSLKLAPARSNSSFFETAVKSARTALEKSQIALSEFQRENSIVTIKDNLDIETARLAELSTALVNVQSNASENQSRIAAASRSADSMQEVLNNATIQNLKAEANRLEAALTQLQSRLGSEHPTVKSVQAELRTTRSRLASESSRVIGSLTSSGSANLQREVQARSALEAQKVRILRLRALRDQATVLDRDVETAQKQFDAATERYSQASLESQYKMTNVSVLSVATKPVIPSSPQVKLIAAVLLFVGAAIGAALAIGTELLNRRVRSPEDLAAVLRAPVLVVLPDAKSRRTVELMSYEIPQFGLR